MKILSIAVLCLFVPMLAAQSATIHVDAARVENHVSPRMYASFVERMAEDAKWGITAEMLHDRSFEEAPNYLGLPAAWQLEPDERNDIVEAIRFQPTTDEAYPKVNRATNVPEHFLCITVAPGNITDQHRGLPRTSSQWSLAGSTKDISGPNFPEKVHIPGASQLRSKKT